MNQVDMAKESDAAEEYERQATLQALQSQINPHFLYNTLECIRGQALMDGNTSVADMLEALGNFFRYSISRRENVVTLADEINNIRSYMLIQNYRFLNRYQFELEISGGRRAASGVLRAQTDPSAYCGKCTDSRVSKSEVWLCDFDGGCLG
mgnify:CR=1 FL=1